MNSTKILVKSLENLYPGDTSIDMEDGDDKHNIPIEQISPTITEEKLNQDQNLRNDIKHRPDTSKEDIDLEETIWLNLMIINALRIIFFVPNYLIIKPLTFIWLLCTYPFTQLFEKEDHTDNFMMHDADDNTRFPSQDEVNQKTELLKQETMISNSIKSPLSSSAYVIPPPQRLYPLSRNPGRKRKKKTLILDLDETLIHSLSRGSPRSFNNSSSLHMIEIKLNNISTLYYVHKRPYCDFFLKEMSKLYELQIFTASVKEYADPIIDWLESNIVDFKSPTQQQNRVFTKRYYRNDCTYRPGVGYIKDLSQFFPREEDLRNVIILDNSPVSYALHENNAVMIEGWINDQSDRDLLNLLPMLHSLSICIDVRYILGLRSGEKMFERY